MDSHKTRTLRLSNQALEGIEATTDSVARAAGMEAGEKHTLELHAKLNNLCVYPERNPFLSRKAESNVRKCVFNSLTIILYRFTDTYLEIIDITVARTDWLK
jgi:plasmid stabilization system protein ParE